MQLAIIRKCCFALATTTTRKVVYSMMIITCVFLFYFQDDYFYILLSWCYNHGPLERENTEHSHVFACCTPPTAGKIKPIIWSLYIDTTACSLFLFVGDACFRWLLTLKRHPNYYFFFFRVLTICHLGFDVKWSYFTLDIISAPDGRRAFMSVTSC